MSILREGQRKLVVSVDIRLGELIFDLRLEHVELLLHVLVNVVETLLGRVVVGVLPLFVGKGWNHCLVVLFDLESKVVLRGQGLILFCWTFRAYLASWLDDFGRLADLGLGNRFGLFDGLFKHFFIGQLRHVLVDGLDLIHVGG